MALLFIHHLKHVGRVGLQYLIHLYNLSVNHCNIPAIWKRAIIIPIQNHGKLLDQGCCATRNSDSVQIHFTLVIGITFSVNKCQTIKKKNLEKFQTLLPTTFLHLKHEQKNHS